MFCRNLYSLENCCNGASRKNFKSAFEWKLKIPVTKQTAGGTTGDYKISFILLGCVLFYVLLAFFVYQITNILRKKVDQMVRNFDDICLLY